MDAPDLPPGSLRGAPWVRRACRSFRQISRCSSPAPAMMCSPVSSMEHCTIGSDLASRFSPARAAGRVGHNIIMVVLVKVSLAAALATS